MNVADDIAAVRASHAALLATVDALDDATARGASLLPDWDVAMVVTHLAQHADGQVSVLEGASAARYPSLEVRDRAIVLGRGSSAAALQADLRAAIERLETAYEGADWAGQGERLPGVNVEPYVDYPFQRWREVEVHHVDLGRGHVPADWPAALVDRWMDDVLATLPDRADGAALLAWALGRGPAPELGPWR